MDLMALVAKLSLDSSEYEQGINNARGSVDGLGKGITTAMKIGAVAIGTGAAAIGAFAKSAIDTGSQFDSAMSQVAATLGITVDDIKNNVNGAGDTFDALRNKAKEMGAATNFSASEAAEGLNILAMSGYDAESSMSMLEDVLHLAAAGGMDMASAASFISGSMKGFADESKSSAYYANLMAKGATLANTNVTQLGEAMSAGAAGAAAYSQSQESMTIALLRLAEQGEVGAAAGTALSAAMKNLYTPTNQAAMALEELKVSAYDPVTHAARDFNEVVNDLDAALNEVSENGVAKYTEEQKNAYKETIFGIQGFNAFNKMTVTGTEKQMEWANALSQASDGMGEAAKQYDTMTNNLQGDLDIMSSAMDGLKIAVSDELMPAFRQLVQDGTTAIDSLKNAFETGDFENVINVLTDIFTSIIEKLIEVTPQFIEIGATILNSIIQGIYNNAPQILSLSATILQNLSKGIIDGLPIITSGAVEIINGLAQGISQNLPQLIPVAMQTLMDFSGSLRENVGLIVDAGLNLIMTLAESLIDNLPVFIQTVPTIVSNIAGIINDNAPKLLACGIELIGKLAAGVIQSIPVIVQEFPKILKMIADVITAFNWVSLGQHIINFLTNGIKSLIATIPDTIKGIVNTAGDVVKNFGWSSLGRGIIEVLKQGIQSLVSDVPNALLGIARSASAQFKAFDWLSLGSNIISGIVSGITGGIGRVMGAITGMASDVIDAGKKALGIASPSKVFKYYGKMVDEGFALGISDNMKHVDDAIDNLTGFNAPIQYGFNGIGIGSGMFAPVINVNVYGTENQTAEDIGQAAIDAVNREIQSMRGVWGHA